jgi:lipopolysaccharide biosynthesis protein
MAIILEVGNGIGSGECDIFFDALFLTQHNKMKERKRKRITALNGEGEREKNNIIKISSFFLLVAITERFSFLANLHQRQFILSLKRRLSAFL